MKVVFYSLLLLGLFSCSDNSADNPETVAETAVPGVPEVTEPAKEDRTEVVNNQTKDSHTAPVNKSVEDQLLQEVMSMAEVRSLTETISEKSNGKHRLKSYIAARPSDDAEYYTINLAEDNGAALTTLHIFHVYPDNTMVYDVVSDREISLKEWRKSL